jgi:hypothetical protein
MPCICRPQTTDAENNYKTRKKNLYSCLAYFECHMQTSDYRCRKGGRGATNIKHESHIETVAKPVGKGYFAQK